MRARLRGMTLIEVLVAMTIFAFGILGMLGMQARAISELSDAKYRTDATLLADALINDVWADRANIANYAYGGTGSAPAKVQPWLSQVQAVLPKANAFVTVNGGNQVTVQVTWQPLNAATQHQHTEIATVQSP
ncbi:MAG TPA: type IV pilus modification protein PilV [Mycobacterium sp.]|nr:type IV pilus modification protein PilV [Mycobacterium sp.]